MKKLLSIIMALLFLTIYPFSIFAENGEKNKAESIGFYDKLNFDLDYEVGGAYLCEATTGRVLYAKNEFKAASPASVTKVMTLLLVMEALEAGKFALSDVVSISAKAASMGGSQVFLEEGERITVEELIKATVIASGNDSSYALAELTAGSESAFVRMMNEKAASLGLKNTYFENVTGLDDTTEKHFSCAADIAVMSRCLISHPLILKYSSIWQDTIRNGEFTLTNTNRLVRYYEGCNGLKTGSTDKAGYCISATAKRGNMQLIAVVMGAKTRDERNAVARELLDFGFSNFALYEKHSEQIDVLPVLKGKSDNLAIYSAPFSTVVKKADLSSVEIFYEIPERLVAPKTKDEIVGKIIFKIRDEQIGSADVFCSEEVEKITVYEVFIKILKRMVCG